jgi:hypothetical protein
MAVGAMLPPSIFYEKQNTKQIKKGINSTFLFFLIKFLDINVVNIKILQYLCKNDFLLI